jgi:hypothetical protein
VIKPLASNLINIPIYTVYLIKATVRRFKELEVSSYIEQLDRLKRSYEKLVQIDKGRKHDLHSDYYRDEIYVFFLNCHHLKDWLKKDSTFQVSNKSIENYINNNNDLRLCADICNAYKHVSLNCPRSTESPIVGGQNINLKLGEDSKVISIKFVIDTESGPRDGFDLATNCLKLWESFIDQHT